jgi:hypothetical protein
MWSRSRGRLQPAPHTVRKAAAEEGEEAAAEELEADTVDDAAAPLSVPPSVLSSSRIRGR